MEEQLKGKGLLKVIGILYIIFSAFVIIFSLLAPAAIRILRSVAERMESGAADAMLRAVDRLGSVTFIVATGLVTGIIELAAGIIAVKYCGSRKRAALCIIFGIVLVAAAIFNQVSGMIIRETFRPFGFIISLVLPVLYLLGAILNKAGKGES